MEGTYRHCLAMVVGKSMGNEKVQGIVMVEDFLEDFALPLYREIEFGIELELATALNHMAPYRTALVELKEEKA